MWCLMIKTIQGLVDEGNHDTLQFENEHIGDIIDGDEDKCSHKKFASADVIPSMDNPYPSMDDLSVDRHTSTDNQSTDISSSRNLNFGSRSMNLGGGGGLLKVRDHLLISKHL